MLAGPVEAHLPRQLYIPAQVLVRRGRQDAFGEITLVEDQALVEGTVVQEDPPVADFDLAHPEIAVHGVEDPSLGVEQLHPQVVEVRRLGAPKRRLPPPARVRRFWLLAAGYQRQATLDERRLQREPVVENALVRVVDRDTEGQPRLEPLDADLGIQRGRVHVRGKPQRVYAPPPHGLEPDGLPDPGGPGVEDPLRLLPPVLLAARDRHVPARVLRPDGNHVLPVEQGVGDVSREGRVPALVRDHVHPVDPDGRAVVHGAEVQQKPVRKYGRLERPGVPDDVV